MSIFNKGFAKFVKKQLDTRKAILSNNGSNDNEILGDNSRSKNYLNYQTKTPFVRLTSGVDIPKEYISFFPISNNTSNVPLYITDPLKRSNTNTNTFPTPQIYNPISTLNYSGDVLKNILGVGYGDDLAKNFVLEAGTLTKQSSPPTPSISSLRKGFDILGADSTYGLDKGFNKINIDDPSEVFNESGDEFGIRPMPGITNVVINSRSTTSVGLKGLRECTISIKCHSISQLQVIELLYMRPGYTALLEWGHSVYFVDNDINTGPTQNIHYIDIFDGNKTRFDVYDEIFEEKIKSNGNYDAILGKVNNFSWTADDNGGYDITVNIISMNDIIDSLKINQIVLAPTKAKNNTENGINSELEEDQQLGQNAISFVFGNIYKRFGIINNARYEGRSLYTFDKLFPNYYITGDTRQKLKKLFPKDSIIYNQLRLQITNPNKDNKNWHNYQVYITFNDLIKFINSSCIPWEGVDNKQKVIKIKEFENGDFCRTHPYQISVDPMTCLITPSEVATYIDTEGNVQQIDESNIETRNGNEELQKYLSAEFLLAYFQPGGNVYPQEVLDSGIPTGGLNRAKIYVNFLNNKTELPKYGFTVKEGPTSPVGKTIIVTSPNNDSRTFYLNYDNATSSYKLNDIKRLNKIGIDGLKDTGNSISKTVNSTSTIPEGSKVIFFKYGRNNSTDDKLNEALKQYYLYREDSTGKGRFRGRMKDILINIQYIINTSDNSQDKDGDVFLKDFLINLFRGIEQATGQVNNFALTPYEGDYTTDSSGITKPDNVEINRIIDENMMNASFESRENYYEFPILKYNSLVTDYKLSSTISNAISTTVSIAAQNVGAGHAATGENSIFNAFNQGIKDRLAQPIIDNVNDPKEINDLEQQKLNNLRGSLYSIYYILQRIHDNNISFPSDTSQAKKTLTDYINYYTSNKPSVNKLFYSFTPFPLTLNLTIDGISGIAVGSIIRLPVDRLPLLYRYLDPEAEDDSFNQAKVAFVIFGVDHTVDDRGWFTNLTCQMVMMPRQSDAKKADKELEGNTKVDSDKDKEIKDIEDTDATSIPRPPQPEEISKGVKLAQDLMKDLSLTKVQASGIVGNIRAESNIIPNRVQGVGTQVGFLKLDGTTGYGYSQWTWESRQKSLATFAQSKGINYKTTQLSDSINYDFIIHEFTKETEFINVLNELKNTNTLKDAVNLVLFKYERPENQLEPEQNKRLALAQQILNKLT
jgi:hypothetical protein